MSLSHAEEFGSFLRASNGRPSNANTILFCTLDVTLNNVI